MKNSLDFSGKIVYFQYDMLKKLKIKNFALIKDITIDFRPGLNIITGETGAGKSIIINALQLILGQKADPAIIRSDEDFAVVEAVFEYTDDLQPLLEAEGLSLDAAECCLMRQINRNGKNRAMVDDQIISLAGLKSITSHLLDIHGQHQHQSLLDEHEHLKPFDRLGPYQSVLQDYQNLFAEYSGLRRQYQQSQREYQESLKQKEWLEFQIRELNRYQFEPDEDLRLEDEIKRLANSQLLADYSTEILENLYESDESVLNRVRQYEKKVRQMSEIDNQLQNAGEMFAALVLTIEELGLIFIDYSRKITHDPQRLQQLEKRLGDIETMSMKYKKKLNELIDYHTQTTRQLEELDLSSEHLNRMSDELSKLESRLIELGKTLSTQRKEFGPLFCRNIEDKLQVLGMSQARFSVEWLEPETMLTGLFQPVVLSENGMENLRYLVTANPGNPLMPISRIASGGEISRIMLALKSVLADVVRIPCMIFDEIDIGISGRIAEMVGKEMLNLSNTTQIICITHLHQIAGMGSHHLVVNKKIDRQQTYTEITPVEGDARIEEIAKMISGGIVSDSARAHARQIIQPHHQGQ
ncbi:MAG: DNA repair protein RecN [Candidatus Delongbacteria bacterium]|nr:DNA repair protein RecN [Candidatus Delongbacteria bacterium]